MNEFLPPSRWDEFDLVEVFCARCGQWRPIDGDCPPKVMKFVPAPPEGPEMDF
jgi:hypothetical protein